VDDESREELERLGRVGARGRAVGLVGDDADDSLFGVVGDPRERDGGACGVTGELRAALRVVGLDSHAMVDVEAGVRPGEHGVGGLGGEEALLHEGGEHFSPEELGENVRVVKEEWHEGAVVAVGTVGDEEVEVGEKYGTEI
jgi:hypothetical protein